MDTTKIRTNLVLFLCNVPTPVQGVIYPVDVVLDAIKQIPQEGLYGTFKGLDKNPENIAIRTYNFRVDADDAFLCDCEILETEKGIALYESMGAVKYKLFPAGIGDIDDNGLVTNYRIDTVGIKIMETIN